MTTADEPIAVRRGPLFTRQRLGLAALFVGLVASLTPWATPAIALALGVMIALTLGNPLRTRLAPVSKILLQTSVVLLGFGMDLPTVLKTGGEGALFAVGSIGATLGLGYLLGRALGVNRTAGTLISTGTAICGGSAIAAVGSAVDADEGQIAMSMGTVFLLNGLALYLFPVFGHALGLTQQQFGTWAGIAIHDVSSVVGAAKEYGDQALQTATAVKLSRVLWIIPITLVMAWSAGRADSADGGACAGGGGWRKRLRIPWFIGLFLLASLLRGVVPSVSTVAPALTHLAKAGLTVTLFLIGAGLSIGALRSVGPRALVLGVALWGFISSASLGVILLSR